MGVVDNSKALDSGHLENVVLLCHLLPNGMGNCIHQRKEICPSDLGLLHLGGWALGRSRREVGSLDGDRQRLALGEWQQLSCRLPERLSFC